MTCVLTRLANSSSLRAISLDGLDVSIRAVPHSFVPLGNAANSRRIVTCADVSCLLTACVAALTVVSGLSTNVAIRKNFIGI